MTPAALLLIVVAAFLHAGWNLLVKRTPGGIVFVWLLSAAAAVLYAPLAWTWLVLSPPSPTWALVACVCASALFHFGYFISLQRGYRVGDLSVVYPLARGTGPLL